MNAFWVCLCLSAYGRPFVACCPRQHTRLTAPLFHTRRSRRLPKRAFSDTPPYHYITPLPHTKFAHSTHRVPPHTKFAHSTHHAHAHFAHSTHHAHAHFAHSTHCAPTYFACSTHHAHTYTLRTFHSPRPTYILRAFHSPRPTYTLRVFHTPSSTHTPRPPPSYLKPSDIVLYFTFNSYKVKSYRCRLNSGFLLPAATAAGLFAQTRPGQDCPYSQDAIFFSVQ